MVNGVLSHPHANRVRENLGSFHPRASTLNLEWTFMGGWPEIPKTHDNHTGPGYFNFWVVRLEPYVDTDGVLRRAFAYGDDSRSLQFWYSVEEMQAAMEWVIPENSPWANTKIWNNELKASP